MELSLIQCQTILSQGLGLISSAKSRFFVTKKNAVARLGFNWPFSLFFLDVEREFY